MDDVHTPVPQNIEDIGGRNKSHYTSHFVISYMIIVGIYTKNATQCLI